MQQGFGTGGLGNRQQAFGNRRRGKLGNRQQETRNLSRRGAYPRARFREAEQIARKGDAVPFESRDPASSFATGKLHSFRESVGTSIARPRLRSKQLPAGQSCRVSNGICLRQIAFVPNAGQAMLVPTAENDRVRFFRRGSVVDPCGRVDTRPYEAVVLRARGYAPLQGAVPNPEKASKKYSKTIVYSF